MKILLIDTSTHVFSIALSEDGILLADFSADAGPAASARIPGHIESLLVDSHTSINDIDAFAVTVGPGAFTGLRVGISLVKGLAYSTDRQVIQLSSLELLAQNAKKSSIPVCTMFDARKGEVYSALYSFTNGMELLLPEAAIAPELLLEKIDGTTLFIGDGAVRYRELITDKLGSRALFAEDHLHAPQAAAGIHLAHGRLDAGMTISPFELQPRYLRLSEAELSRK